MTEGAPPRDDDNHLLRSVRLRKARHRRWQEQGEPSLARYLAQVGVLGWTIVTPALLGLFLGRWLDHRLGTGIFWSAPLLLLGVVLGCWTAWRWMHAA
jgi:ATP synthase protein I